MGSSSKGFSCDVLPRLNPNPIEKSRYQVYGDPKPDGTCQIQKTLWDGTNIQVSQRVGDEERMWVRDKLGHLYILGFLNTAEYQSRDSAAEKAVTRESLNKLISDLPAHEDDWKGARKLLMDKALLKEAVEAAYPKKSSLANAFPVLLLLGFFAVMAGIIGLDDHATTALTVYAAMLTFMGIVSFWAGSLLARMT